MVPVRAIDTTTRVDEHVLELGCSTWLLAHRRRGCPQPSVCSYLALGQELAQSRGRRSSHPREHPTRVILKCPGSCQLAIPSGLLRSGSGHVGSSPRRTLTSMRYRVASLSCGSCCSMHGYATLLFTLWYSGRASSLQSASRHEFRSAAALSFESCRISSLLSELERGRTMACILHCLTCLYVVHETPLTRLGRRPSFQSAAYAYASERVLGWGGAGRGREALGRGSHNDIKKGTSRR